MSTPGTNPIVPEQQHGAESFTESESVFDTPARASERYDLARMRLFNISQWKQTANGGAAFLLTDDTGKAVERKPEEGDYIRIRIPGVPETDSGSGAEWVRIERVAEDVGAGNRSASITVRPAPCPINNVSSTAHFFSGDASSTFRVQLDGRKVRAMVIGKNELPNTATPSLMEKLRNLVVGLAAMAGLNKPQWKKLVNGLLKPAS